MIGKTSGMCKMLNDELDKFILCHHCLCHKLQLALRGVNFSRRNPPLCKNCVHVEKVNNKIAALYNQSHKKKSHLKKFLKDNHYDPFIPQKTFAVR